MRRKILYFCALVQSTMSFFKKKPKEYRATSLSELTWQRFKKEKEGMISLGFILLVIIIAVLGYLITPDHSPHCNHQQLELALRSPGTRCAPVC